MLTFLMVSNIYSIDIKLNIAEKSRLQTIAIGHTQQNFGRDAILGVAKSGAYWNTPLYLLCAEKMPKMLLHKHCWN